jgi:hypothetical protein
MSTDIKAFAEEVRQHILTEGSAQVSEMFLVDNGWTPEELIQALIVVGLRAVAQKDGTVKAWQYRRDQRNV